METLKKKKKGHGSVRGHLGTIYPVALCEFVEWTKSTCLFSLSEPSRRGINLTAWGQMNVIFQT